MNAPRIQRPKIAVLGVGHVGSSLTHVLIDAGYDVSVSASGDPQKIDLIAKIILPGSTPRWAADAAAEADIVVLAIPLHKFESFDPSIVKGKIVVDVMNYWAPTDGTQSLFEDALSSSEIVQRRLPGSTVVKAFNHIGYHELEEHRAAAGSSDRQALGVAGDDPEAVDLVAEVIENVGYDAVVLDSLSAGRSFEPGEPVFGARLRRAEFEQAVRADAAA